jgi:acetolactate synthase I/II/III large subunit
VAADSRAELGGGVAATLAAALCAHGVDRVFCVPGESYLSLLEAIARTGLMDVVTTRHEGSAGFAALADAKLTGRAGVCLVSRGPGATNASIAVQAAMDDATPLLLIVGQVARGQSGRRAFQEIDVGSAFSGFAKATWTLTEPGRAAEFVHRALHVAETGTPGPTVLAIPEDVCASPESGGEIHPARGRVLAEAGMEGVARAAALLSAADRPLLLAGERLATPAGRAALSAAAQRHVLPVVTTNKNQHLIDNLTPHFAGHLTNSTSAAQRAAWARADVVLAVGTRLDQVTTRGHRFPPIYAPEQPLVHVYPDPVRLGEVHRPALAVCADPTAFLNALAARPSGVDDHHRTWLSELRGLVDAEAVWQPAAAADGVVFGEVVAALGRLTRGQLTVAVDSGGFTSWIYRYLRLAGDATMLGISNSAMGFGVPAAVAAALRCPGRPTVAIVGDGGFGMTGSELATAVARRLPLVVIIANNCSYGTIRHHQERVFPGSVVGTELVNPDFARVAEAHGALGLTASTPQDVEAALAKALAHHQPAVVEVRTSLRRFSAFRMLGEGGDA